MGGHLLYDPKTKHLIKTRLQYFLFYPVVQDHQKKLDLIVSQNCHLQGIPHKSFSFKGNLYSTDSTPPPRKANRLSSALHRKMSDFLEELETFRNHEQLVIEGYIDQVLNSSKELHDYLHLFPESTHSHIKDIIDTCRCEAPGLKPEEIQAFLDTNKHALQVFKERLALNLLL